MKTIKIFLNEDGTINNFVQDIRINQYSFQDTLLNIYVPYSIVDLNMTSDDVNIIYGTNIQMGMIYTRQNGTEQMGVGYLFTFVKDNVVLNNKRYVLFERTMPKEFTLYSGNQTYAINVVNTKTETTLDDNNEEVSTTSITSIITSARYTLYITPSANFSEDTSETTDLENVISQINSLLAQIILKQDKTDSNINVYTTKLHDATTQIVVNALNSLNTREVASENNLDTLNNDMSQAQQDIINLQNTLIVGYRYLGQITSASDPSSAALTSWATSQGYTLQNGDEIIWVKTVSQGTDIIYVCKYVQTWNWYAVPSVEPAGYLSLGLVKGTTTGMIPPTETAPMLVQIANGEILYIYIRKSDGTYSTINQMLNNHELTIEQMLDGTLSIDKATYALYDESERNKVNKTTINDKFTTPTQVQNQIMDYALPKMFNDLYYFDFDNDTLETSASDLPVSTSYAELDVSTIGTKQVFENTLTFTDTFTLSNKNSFDISLKYDNADLYGESIDLTLNIYVNDDVSPIVSQTKTMVLDASGVLEFRDNLTSIIDEIEIEPNDYIRVELTALVSTAQNVNTIKFYSYQNVVSTFNLNISMAGLIVSEAKKGEYYHFTKTATWNAIDLEVDIAINDSEIPFENLLNGNFIADFDITLNSTFEFSASQLFFPLKVIYTNNFLGTTTTIDMTTRYGEYFIYYRPVYTLEKITDNGVTTYVYHFKFIARYGNNADNTFYVDYPNSTIIKVTKQEMTDDAGMGFHYIIGKKIPYIIVDEVNADMSNKLINNYLLDDDYMAKGYDADTSETTMTIKADRLDVDKIKATNVKIEHIQSYLGYSSWISYCYDSLGGVNYKGSRIYNESHYSNSELHASSEYYVYDENNKETGIIIENTHGNIWGNRPDVLVVSSYLSFAKSLIYDVVYNDDVKYNNIDKSMYNLGAFDTINGNVITRQTGYADLSNFTWVLHGSVAHLFTASLALTNATTPVDNSTPAEMKCAIYTTDDWNTVELANLQIAMGTDGSLRIMDESCSTADELKAKLVGVAFQYKLATSYTEKVIENQPLLTLNQDGCNFLNDEYLKQENLCNVHGSYSDYNQTFTYDGSTVVANGTNNKGSDNYLPYNPFRNLENGTYLLKFYNLPSGLTFDAWEGGVHYIIDSNKELLITLTDTLRASNNWRFVASRTSSFDNITINVMLVKGSTPATYQPYNGPIVHKADIEPVLLWENSSPDSSFAAQNITVQDMSAFKYIVIGYKINDGSANAINYHKIKHDNSYFQICNAISGTNNFYSREFQFVNSTTIRIISGYYNGSVSDSSIIPVEIYGTNIL